MKLFQAALAHALTTVSETASAIAKARGISQSQMSAFVSKGTLPKDETLVELCKAFRPTVAADIAKAWVHERLGAELADGILSADMTPGSLFERTYLKLPQKSQKAFLTLMTAAAEDADLRGSMEQLAAYIEPAPSQIEQQQQQQQSDAYRGFPQGSRVAEEHGQYD